MTRVCLLCLCVLALASPAAASDPAAELKARTYDCVPSGEVVWCGTTYGLVAHSLNPPRAGDRARARPADQPLPESVSALALSDDRLAAALGGEGLRTWRVGARGELIAQSAWQSRWSVVGVSFAGADLMVALGSGGWARLAPAEGTWTPRVEVDTAGYVRQIEALPDGRWLVAEGRAGLSLWEPGPHGAPLERERYKSGHDVRAFALGPAGDEVVVADGLGGLVALRLGDGRLVERARMGTPDIVHGLAWVEGLVLAASGKAGLIVTSPLLVRATTLRVEGLANRVRVVGARALVASDYRGLQIVDLEAVETSPRDETTRKRAPAGVAPNPNY